MAVDYTTLFTRIGRFVDKINDYLTFQGTTLMGANEGADDILDEYTARRDLVTGLQEYYEQLADNVASWITILNGYVLRTLIDQAAELNVPTLDPLEILRELNRHMIEDSESVDANDAGSSVTPFGSNVGSGTLVVSLLNDDGDEDQRVIAESIEVRCESDVNTGSSEHNEYFEIEGWPINPVESYKTRGSGGPTGLTLINGSTLLLNGTFESFTVTDTPDNWDIDNGVAGTTLFETSSTVALGSKAFELRSNGAATTLGISQAVSTYLTGGRLYVAGIMLRKDGGAWGVGVTNLTVKVISATAGTLATIYDDDPTNLTTTYVQYTAFFATDKELPSDITFEIEWTSVNNQASGRAVFVDEAVIAEPTRHGHVAFALFDGTASYRIGDYFTVGITNDYAGVFQTYFARFFDHQLPSDSGGSETINDSLAT